MAAAQSSNDLFLCARKEIFWNHTAALFSIAVASHADAAIGIPAFIAVTLVQPCVLDRLSRMLLLKTGININTLKA